MISTRLKNVMSVYNRPTPDQAVKEVIIDYLRTNQQATPERIVEMARMDKATEDRMRKDAEAKE